MLAINCRTLSSFTRDSGPSIATETDGTSPENSIGETVVNGGLILCVILEVCCNPDCNLNGGEVAEDDSESCGRSYIIPVDGTDCELIFDDND